MATKKGKQGAELTAGPAATAPEDSTEVSESQSRQRILREALALFSEHDYGAVTMRKLAKAVGLNQGTLYHHYSSKDELYRAVLRDAYVDRTAALLSVARSSGSREERLRGECLLLCRDLSDNVPFVKLVKREQLAGDKERMQLLIDMLFGAWIEAMQDLFAEFDSSFDTELLTSFFTGMIVHYYETTEFRQLRLGASSNQTPEYVADQVYRVLLGALGSSNSPTKK